MTSKYVTCLTIAAVAAFAAASPVRIIRMIDTRETHDLSLDLLRQETIELRVRLSNYGVPIDLSGWYVVLHGRTNGQSEAYSYQATGVAGIPGDAASAADGWMSVEVDVDTWWPHGVDNGLWTLSATNASSVRIMRAGGPLTVSGTAAADARAPLPQSVADSLIYDIQAETQARAAGDLARPTFQQVTNLLIGAGTGGPGALVVSANEALRLIQSDTNAWIAVDSGAPRLYVIAKDTTRVTISSLGSSWTGPPAGIALTYVGYSDPASIYNGPWGETAELLAFVGGGPVSLTATMYDPPGEQQWTGTGNLPATLSGTEPGNTCVLDYTPITNTWYIATEADLAAVTNHLIRTYLITSNSWMSVSNDMLSIYAPFGGTGTVASLVWQSGAAGVDPAATNALWQALASGLSAKADKAWGQYAPDGSSNPDPSYMTFINAPALVHAPGYQWASSGAYHVLSATGAVAFISGGGGEARWGLDMVSNYVGFVRGGSFTVGAIAASFATQWAGSPSGTVSIAYAIDDGDFPSLWFTTDLATSWDAVEGVWIDNGDGTATVLATATVKRGFWQATTTRSVESIFVSKPPSRFDGGVFGATNAPPVKFDSTITVSSGGKTYKIPAELVP